MQEELNKKLEAFPIYLAQYIAKKLDIIDSDITNEESEFSKEFHRGYVTACDNILSASENYFTEAGNKFVDEIEGSGIIKY
jgi:hypothetical protein